MEVAPAGIVIAAALVASPALITAAAVCVSPQQFILNNQGVHMAMLLPQGPVGLCKS